MVKPATHVVAVLVLELDAEVPPVCTIGAHPEVTLGQTYALPLDHTITKLYSTSAIMSYLYHILCMCLVKRYNTRMFALQYVSICVRRYNLDL